MDTSNKVSVSPRATWKRTSSFGVGDPGDAVHYPALSGATQPSAAAGERKLSRMSSSFKDMLNTAESVGQPVPAEIATKPLPAIIEAAAADSPRISAARPKAVEASAELASVPDAQVEPPQVRSAILPVSSSFANCF